MGHVDDFIAQPLDVHKIVCVHLMSIICLLMPATTVPSASVSIAAEYLFRSLRQRHWEYHSMSALSVIAVCILIVAVLFTITCVVFYINKEDVSSFIFYHSREFRLRYITPRSHIIGMSPITQPSRRLEKIDTHHHMIPPVYLERIKQEPKGPDGVLFPTWSPQISLDFMARNSISTSILSFAHTALEDPLLCQEINIYAHNLRLQYPTKFGFFATIPAITVSSIPDVLSSLKFCYKKLNPEGVTLFTSYDGKYLGHELFQPIWEELNRVNAVVFIHPIANSLTPPSLVHPFLIPPIADFTHEITLTACSLIYSNTLFSYPNLKIILSHAGGTLPYISSRVANLAYDASIGVKTPEQFMREARSFYTDLAANSYSGPVEYVESWLGPGKTTYGSDFPFIRERTTVGELSFLDGWIYKNGEEGKAVMRQTALDLFPRLKAQIEKAQDAKKGPVLENVSTSSSESGMSGDQNV
ncbi:718eb788-366e-4817-b320-026ba66f0043 [Sclerotinia trifoliorum]|uniref:6-methylsalicylate decarboxylase n=1 Tax=Sclerotinia trifoliorum TaxID=28548 RepID=A0A8H2W0Y7_9HELO|nr:718eb788-366e-4817-b320-026ba66f0043 [Sclerotinia trifoliorum]